MALCDLLKNTIHERRDDSDRQSIRRKRQIPLLLFEDKHLEQVDNLVKATASPQIERGILQLSSSGATDYDELFVVISPEASKRSSPIAPNAPVKPRRLFSKVGLKPKKLHFVDKEENGGRAAQDKHRQDERANYSRVKSNKSEPVDASSSTSILGKQSRDQLNRRNLNRMLENMRLDANNKENKRFGKEQQDRKAKDGRSVARERARSTKSSHSHSARSSIQSSSLRDLRRCPSVLSDCKDDLTWRNKLLWLQPRRDIGMMIQCCRNNCKKWRYCDDYHDPTDVPEIWYCEMNSDKSMACCFVPQIRYSKKFQEDLIENKYNAGSIVWARVNGYPWWPAIVDDCPDFLRYYELRKTSIIPIRYHVTFLNQHLHHVWLSCKRIKPFVKYDRHELVKKTVYHGIDHKEQLDRAYALAQKAIPLSIFGRLQVFSYIAQLRRLEEPQSKRKMWDIVDQDDDEIIPGTPTAHTRLKEFHSSVKSSMDSSNTF